MGRTCLHKRAEISLSEWVSLFPRNPGVPQNGGASLANRSIPANMNQMEPEKITLT